MKTITVVVRPEHAGGDSARKCLIARAIGVAIGREVSIPLPDWRYVEDEEGNPLSYRTLPKKAIELAHEYNASGYNPTRRAALLASLPQSFELEVPDGQG